MTCFFIEMIFCHFRSSQYSRSMTSQNLCYLVKRAFQPFFIKIQRHFYSRVKVSDFPLPSQTTSWKGHISLFLLNSSLFLLSCKSLTTFHCHKNNVPWKGLSALSTYIANKFRTPDDEKTRFIIVSNKGRDCTPVIHRC